MTPRIAKRQKEYFIIGALISLLLHIWLLIAFIHLKAKKPHKNKPLQITLIQKGLPNQRILPKAMPIPMQKPSSPKLAPRKPVRKEHAISKPSNPIHKPSTTRYEALPSNILKSLPKSTYTPKANEETMKEAYSSKGASKTPVSSSTSNTATKEGEVKHNAKANLNLNIKQFVKKEESVYQYLSWLIRYLNRQARERDLYPKEAKRLGIKGEVVVRVTINKDGTIDMSSLKVVQSSGYKILDESAPRIIRELSPFRKPPKRITINLPVYFLINGYY